MNHFIFNFVDGYRTQAASHLRRQAWPVGRDERHRDLLAPGDLVLIYVALEGEFIGRAEVANAVHDSTPTGAGANPERSSGEVALAAIEEWDPAVSLASVIAQIDPTGANPHVQANAAGFPAGVVLITADEYATAVALSRARGM